MTHFWRFGKMRGFEATATLTRMSKELWRAGAAGVAFHPPERYLPLG
jgi:hypothetical protein